MKISREHKSDLQRIDNTILAIGKDLMAKADNDADRAEIKKMMDEVERLKTGIAYQED